MLDPACALKVTKSLDDTKEFLMKLEYIWNRQCKICFDGSPFFVKASAYTKQ